MQSYFQTIAHDSVGSSHGAWVPIFNHNTSVFLCLPWLPYCELLQGQGYYDLSWSPELPLAGSRTSIFAWLKCVSFPFFLICHISQWFLSRELPTLKINEWTSWWLSWPTLRISLEMHPHIIATTWISKAQFLVPLGAWLQALLVLLLAWSILIWASRRFYSWAVTQKAVPQSQHSHTD